MIWKTLEINPDYAVSDCGQVMRVTNGRIRIPVADKDGYLRVSLSVRGRMRIVSVHRLVATAYIPNPLGKRCVNHIDGDKANNRVANLEWATDSENWKHAIRTGLSNPRTRCKLSPQALKEIATLSRSGVSDSEIAPRYGVGRVCIHRFLSGVTHRNVRPDTPSLISS